MSKWVSKQTIQKEIKEMAARLNKKFENQKVVIVGVLNGSFMFLTDLSKQLTFPYLIDFVAYSSYQNNKKIDHPVISKGKLY